MSVYLADLFFLVVLVTVTSASAIAQQVIATIPVGDGPQLVAVNPATNGSLPTPIQAPCASDNARPSWLVDAHRKLDEAVFAAYGWPATLADAEVLEHLLRLNQQRGAGANVHAIRSALPISRPTGTIPSAHSE